MISLKKEETNNTLVLYNNAPIGNVFYVILNHLSIQKFTSFSTHYLGCLRDRALIISNLMFVIANEIPNQIDAA